MGIKAVYAQVKDVEARLSSFPLEGGKFTKNTEPTVDHVARWLCEYEAKLNACLYGVGLPAPYSSKHALYVLGVIVATAVEGRVRQVYAAARGGGDDDGQEQLQAFKDACKDIRENQSYWADALGEGTQVADRNADGYVLNNNDGKSIGAGDFAPTFTKGMVF